MSPGRRSSLSPLEGAISRPPGLISPSFHTPVTKHILSCSLFATYHFPAGLNHCGLFIHHTPAALSGWIVCNVTCCMLVSSSAVKCWVCICIHVYMLFCVLWFTSHSVPCSLGHQHCVAVCGVPLFSVLFFACWRFCCLIKCFTSIWTQTPISPRCPLPAPWQFFSFEMVGSDTPLAWV